MSTLSITDWTWSWGPSGGIAASHSFGDNLFWDIIRLAVVIGAAVLVMGCLRVLAEEKRRRLRMPWTQKCRFLALMLSGAYLGGTEAWIMGTTATPRLLVAVAVITLGLMGVWGIRQKQLKEPIVEAF